WCGQSHQFRRVVTCIFLKRKVLTAVHFLLRRFFSFTAKVRHFVPRASSPNIYDCLLLCAVLVCVPRNTIRCARSFPPHLLSERAWLARQRRSLCPCCQCRCCLMLYHPLCR